MSQVASLTITVSASACSFNLEQADGLTADLVDCLLDLLRAAGCPDPAIELTGRLAACDVYRARAARPIKASSNGHGDR